MKGATGLIVAVFLGLAGALLNWFYLDSKTRDIKNMMFVGVKEGAAIEPGQLIERSRLEQVPVPERFGTKLKQHVFLWDDVATLVDQRAPRRLEGGQLFFRSYYVTPPNELELKPGEVHYVVPVDNGNVVAEFLNPGDRIMFVLPASQSIVSPTPASGELDEPAAPAAIFSGVETIGPFRVKSVGSRLSSAELARGSRSYSAQERLIGIVVDENDAAEKPQFDKLVARDVSGSLRNVRVKLLARTSR
jgi:hypothetical protein